MEKSKRNNELDWKEQEAEKIRERILSLKPDQLGVLPFLVGVKFSREDLEEVISEIKNNRHNSINIDVIVYEAESKEELLWWLNYFEKFNK